MATITKDLLKTLREELNAAIKLVGDKHGVELQVGVATFTPTNATFKLAVNAKDASGSVVTKEWSDLKRYQQMLGLSDEHLAQVFTLGGLQFTLAGYRVKATSKPFLIKRVSDEKVFIAAEDSVRRALGLEVSSLNR